VLSRALSETQGPPVRRAAPDTVDDWVAAMSRQIEATVQMQQRSGPIYEASTSRSRTVNEAWRAAGSPRRVRRTIRNRQRVFYVDTPHGPRDATDDEVQAWYRWCSTRENLRREIGASGVSGTDSLVPGSVDR
jgi:hypothetical protein